MKSDKDHYRNLERALFAPSGTAVPGWLMEGVRECQDRYAEIKLTDQFKAAINSFDDGGTPKPFELFVVGEGKFGKSTIVNCLLGEEQSKVRGLPETRCFLRYVVTDRPGDKARVYLRAKRGVHDWILERVGRGVPVKELFDLLEHTVSFKTARELLDGEIDRLDAGGYEPAIYEIERDVRRTQQTAFRNPIRVVDTQGLDQLFPDELRKSAQGMVDDTTAERFIQWMNGSARGKHLEWQFRRCDAVLWCVNAKRIGSASTLASMRYFAGYAKKIVIVLTNVDIARNEGERSRLLEAATKKYGMYSTRIIPVNGLAAWNGISGGDEKQLADSGFEDLVHVLADICEVEGIKVRNMSRYLGLRHTESQFRLALKALSEDYGALQKKYELDKVRIGRSLEKDWEAVSDAIARTGNAIARGVQGRINSIGFRDDRAEVDRTLDHHTEVARLSFFVRGQIEKVVLTNVAAQTRLTTEYRLPAFDADGKRSGNKFSIAPEPLTAAISIDIPDFGFVLGDWFDNAVDWMDEKFGWAVGGSDASKQRRAQRLQERREHIDNVFAAEWSRYAETTLAQVKKETVRQYQTLQVAIKAVFGRIEQHAGGSVSGADQNIRVALERLAVPAVFESQMLAALSSTRSGKAGKTTAKPISKPGNADFSHGKAGSHPIAQSTATKAAGSRDVGKRVTHRKLGVGVVVDISRTDYMVKFNGEEKLRKFGRETIRDPEWFIQT